MSTSPIETYAERVKASQSLAEIGDSDGALRLLDIEDGARRRQITIVKQSGYAVVLRRRAELLQNVTYMETQIGRLAKMARDVRAEILLLTTE